MMTSDDNVQLSSFIGCLTMVGRQRVNRVFKSEPWRPKSLRICNIRPNNGTVARLILGYEATLNLERIGEDRGSLSRSSLMFDQFFIYCSCHGNNLDNSGGIISVHF